MSAVPFGPGIDIWRSCRLIGAMMRSLCLLPGGLGRFVPCSTGANHCRLRHVGWERCGHGLLTSRPRESSSVPFLNELLRLFGYPLGLLVHCLLGLFLYGIAPLGLLAGSPLGGCQCLGMLLPWLLLVLRFLVLWVLRFLVGRFTVLVVLALLGRKHPCTPRWF